MIRPEEIAGYSPQLRELLEFSCFYLAATDGKFTSIEQEWIDAHFGEGAADRFIAHYFNTDWSYTFDRIMQIVRHSLTESEKQLVAREARVWLKNFITADGLEPEEQIRLDEFYQWLEKVGLPKPKLVTAPAPRSIVYPPYTKDYATPGAKPLGMASSEAAPPQVTPKKSIKNKLFAIFSGKPWVIKSKFQSLFWPIILLALLIIYIHGIFFGSYIPWDVKKWIVWPLEFLKWFGVFAPCWMPLLLMMIWQRIFPKESGECGCLAIAIFVSFIFLFIWISIFETKLKDMHKPTPKEIKEGWSPSR